MVESPLGVAGIRGTQFGMSVDSKSTELAVLEGKVGFKDANQQTKNVETAQKVVGGEGGVSDVDALPDDTKNELANAVADSNKVASKYDLSRLASTVDGYASKPNYIVKSALNMELIWCPPGGFIMGSEGSEDDTHYRKKPHPVIFHEGFYLGEYEVTHGQFQQVTEGKINNVRANQDAKLIPLNNAAEYLSRQDVIDFFNALSLKEEIQKGWIFTIPTEAQWEYACRAGTESKYYWGDSIDSSSANYKDTKRNKSDFKVGLYPPNPWGFYDMLGNVWELVKFEKALPLQHYGSVARGGSVRTEANLLNTTKTNWGITNTRCATLGFRVCLKRIDY